MQENMNEKLTKLAGLAKENPKLRKALIASETAEDNYDAFCKAAQSFGFDITVGELIAISEEFLSNLLKSCNGGATYPIEEMGDVYESFIMSLKLMK